LFIQLFSWYTNRSNISKFLETRFKYFPEEKYTAYNLARTIGYKSTDCEKWEILNEGLDLIDKKFCELYN
jgi:hypothetical protein